MNELDSRIAQELDDEALFRLAEGEPHEFSSEYHEKMKRLYKKAGVHPKRKMTPMRRIVAVAAIIAVLTGTAAAATFWEDIQRFFVTAFNGYTELRTEAKVEPYDVDMVEFSPEWDDFWAPGRMMSGYSLESTKNSKDRKIMTFSNGEDKLKFYQWPQSSDLRVDGDGIAVSGIYVWKIEVCAIEKDVDGETRRSISWTDGTTSFSLYGGLTFKSLCDVAESLVYIER